jgi:sigma-E factor negative regulatory protein RseB
LKLRWPAIDFKRLLLALFCLPAWLASWPLQADNIDDWLDKMSQSSEQQNYQGTLIIRQRDKMQAIQVKQGISSLGSWQTLQTLTGEKQIIIRHNNQVTTVFPAKKLITVSENIAGSVDKGPLHNALPDNRNILREFYQLRLSGESRVANKVTQILQMVPQDTHRYGYVFWLDQETGLLLKSDLIDEQGHVIEQMMYSDIELLTEAPQKIINADTLKDYRKIRLIGQQDVAQQRWLARQMPAGFKLIRSDQVSHHSKQVPVYHMIYSDGMASVSVFVEQRVEDDSGMAGLSNMGAVNAYSVYLDDVYVTAIGEVPADTVRMIAESVEPIDGDLTDALQKVESNSQEAAQ